MKRLCVFCGSSTGNHPAYAGAARSLGALLARRGLGLVYGGGRVGLMGVVADAVLAGGGEVVGVIPHAFVEREVAHHGLTDLRVVRTMHERKALMAELADGFIGLPGGYGTLDEFCEIITWAQLGIHAKPCALLNTRGFFDAFLAQLDRAAGDGFVQPAMRAMVLSDAEPEALLAALAGYQAPALRRWIEPCAT
jgi:uncharacterized protein (TIGR00730 family)